MATGCTTLLVFACLVAMLIRGYPCGSELYCRELRSFFGPSDLYRSLAFGFCVLAGSIAIGVYLRRAGQQRIETETDALIRRQWPLGAALAVLLLVEAGEVGYVGVVALLGSGGGRGVRVLRTARAAAPTRWAGAAAIVVLPVLLGIGAGFDTGLPLSFTGLAASMAMVAYAVRLPPLCGRRAGRPRRWSART